MAQSPEEFEHIPWSELSAAHDASRSRLLYLVAGVLVALVVGVVAARSLFQPQVAPSGSGVVATSVATSPVTTFPEPAPVTTVPSAPAADPVLYREADLMAALPVADGMRAAVTRAEWFVADYFTADLDPLRAEPVRAALPPGAAVPPLPQDREAPPVSFVEWSRAFDAVPVAPGTYLVSVVYRSIGSTPEGSFRRLPVRAVAVTVAVGSDGGTSVVDLPSPLEVPPGPLVEAWSEPSLALPDAVIGQALQLAARWGENPQIVGGAESRDEWRVVVSVQDDVGNRWPLSIRLDPSSPGVVP